MHVHGKTVGKEIFSRLARPLQHQRTLFNWGDANSQSAKEGGSFEECDTAKPGKNVMQLTQVLNAQNKVHIKRESVLQLNCYRCGSLGARLKTGCQSNFRPRGKTGTEPLTHDMVDGNNLLAITAATPLEEKPCDVTGKEPPPRTCDIG